MAKREYNDLDLSDETAAKPLSAAAADEQSPLGPQHGEPSPFQTPPRPAVMRSSPRETDQPSMRRHRLRDPAEMPEEGTGNRFHIDRKEWPDGFSLQWVTKSVYGQEQPTHTAGFYRRGWEQVWAEDFDGRYDGRWTSPGHKGPIEVDGMILVARDGRWTAKAEEQDRMKAVGALAVKEAQLRGGDLEGVGMDGGARHPSALRTNRIRKTTERLQVPRDE